MTFPRRRLEPVVQRVRARIGKRIILDTTHAQLLFEDERHPSRAIPKDALLAPLAGPAVADSLDGCWWAIELDGTRHDLAVRTWDTPPADCPALASLAVVHHDLADQWLEEEHPVYAMPKNPYHRVGALPSGRHIQVLANGEPLATTRRPALIIETGVQPRWYIPPGDVRWDRLTPQPAPHHLPVQGPGLLLDGRRHQPAATGVELPGTAARGREPGRAHRHSRWRPGSATAHQRRPSPPQERRLTHAPARLAAGSRTPGWADDIEAGHCSGRTVGPLPARGGHRGCQRPM